MMSDEHVDLSQPCLKHGSTYCVVCYPFKDRFVTVNPDEVNAADYDIVDANGDGVVMVKR